MKLKINRSHHVNRVNPVHDSESAIVYDICALAGKAVILNPRTAF